jgi:hypothetical protein
MAWGSLRQHSTGATWENSASHIHGDRILGFLPSFLGKSHSSRKRKLRQSLKEERETGGEQKGKEGQRQQQSFQVLQRKRHPTTRPPTTTPPLPPTNSTNSKHPARAKPIRSIYNNDPAFSADPRSHPYFHDAGHTRNYPPTQSGSSQSRHSTSGGGGSASATNIREKSHHRREPAEGSTFWHPPPQGGSSDDSDEMMEPQYALLSPPNGQPLSGSSHSSESATTTNPSISITPSSSNYSPPQSSSNDHTSSTAPPVKHIPSGSVNRAPELMVVNGPANEPPTYEESIFAEPETTAYEEHTHQELQPSAHQERPRPAIRGISAPELHNPAPPPIQPSRPLTAPSHDADDRPRRRESTAGGGTGLQAPTYNARQRSRELDRIDELDETDPFGGAVHHKGPYEAINAILGGARAAAEVVGDQRYGTHKSSRSKRVRIYCCLSIC